MKVSVILKELYILHIFYFTKKSAMKIDQWFLYNFLSRKESTQGIIERIIHSKWKILRRNETNKLLENWQIVNNNECSK